MLADWRLAGAEDGGKRTVVEILAVGVRHVDGVGWFCLFGVVSCLIERVGAVGC